MLVITRKTDESLLIADNIEVTVLEISKDRVKLGVSAPRDITVIRNELAAAQNANRESAQLISKNALDALINAAKNKS
ncbi:MAG: carbon storage regulator CsrA [Oscillospiraceae bacterium]|jgi:carbon storage regulator|nr:carbon storage regulator CsrA [Oscillospiraceae bacterium]